VQHRESLATLSVTMSKLIVIIAAAVLVIFMLRAIFAGRSLKALRAFSEFKKQFDYLVWVILFVIGCVFVYSVANLIHSTWR
jgi:hypothetical protein